MCYGGKTKEKINDQSDQRESSQGANENKDGP